MSESFDIDGVDRITAGAVGEPGERTFYVQARAGGRTITLLAEKEQVRLLAEALLQLLGTLPETDEGPVPDVDALALEGPLEPEWRVGEMAIEYEDENGNVEIVITEIQSDEEQETDADGTARFVVTRAQARAMATRALEVVAAGRPRCQFCGYPLEPEGHICPAMNGHRSYQE
jgi:uncharacterized repeat protein (TIGR03847 family)